MKSIIAFVAAFAAWAALGPAEAKAPMSAFGDLPAQRAATLSPDGTKVAYIARIDDQDILMLFDFKTNKRQALIRVSNIRARSVAFIGDNHVMLRASKTTHAADYGDRLEVSATFSYNLATQKIVQLLSNTPDLYAQSGLGSIVAVDPDGQHVYMPAFVGKSDKPTRDLLRTDLDTGRGSNVGGKIGKDNTMDWFVSSQGKALAREDFDARTKQHSIFSYVDGEVRRIYFKETSLPEVQLLGVSKQTGALMVLDNQGGEFYKLFEMSPVDGSLSKPLTLRDDADIERLVTDYNRVAYGVQYAGFRPSYEMFDKALDADVKWALESLPGSSVEIDSWSSDWSKVLLHVSGGARPERYILLDRPAHSLRVILNLRPEIAPEDVGKQATIKYKARDGLEIPSLITWPIGVAEDQRKNLPLVVMPHGGPRAHDQVGFNWLAQFLANEGYAVLQPNFRGSDGFGASFVDAGARQWGRKVQDDVTDGVEALIKMGWADRSKVCIVGWSYGGYVALAGGALTPELYKCVASIAGVSDLIDMLEWEQYRYGADSPSFIYWTTQIGDLSRDRQEIESVSPVRHADAFAAPVLLVHGADDTTVPPRQSDRIEGVLRAKGKAVTYIKIKGDDHGLVDNDSRRQMLTALGEFLAKYLR